MLFFLYNVWVVVLNNKYPLAKISGILIIQEILLMYCLKYHGDGLLW